MYATLRAGWSHRTNWSNATSRSTSISSIDSSSISHCSKLNRENILKIGLFNTLEAINPTDIKSIHSNDYNDTDEVFTAVNSKKTEK